ncbi:outer membrane protein assembly factor BamD [Campylobacter hyointestinalis]|uniref:Outer membrane protein assembly factor BamD n=1 Tax=Campylobacter hyointestinalis subsp. hyointestinalis TaxID=91352 RepID=A0A855N759_CAMHY|nr:outer membrane protein assembly factor BamD [Campylobacter hyointestinalis]MDL2347044.1 outer membrane protein assembly factor BamD [Campylobacter hyointestinalis]MDL2348342.1 outer membrane protein assembly factor BamD [Campylobacter hyointestinalis]MDL2350531.1 outer membrane protein assembly factor BamD [Campylobacter hyointestinalis]MDM1025920.1 outer membrane protein assembly factor BamD [Campylobacter hyointestinalis]MDM1027096.1 outer membrane protein assembly factor BamD [Campylobac
METYLKKALLIISLLVFVGCGNKNDVELYNLSPEEWYSQVLKDIQNSDLEEADKHYISFSSEHISSPLLEQMLLILAQANVNDEKYETANAYLDEYIRRYGTKEKIEFANYMKIKANFDSFSKPNRNQKLMQDSIAAIENFLKNYPTTQYRPLIETMLVKFKLAQYYLDTQIYSLYERIDRQESAVIYKDKLDVSPLNGIDMIEPTLPWYMRAFE